nr:alpha-amylase family glycosyl hydrolase [Paenibacillus sp. MMS18-CY102]
MCAHLIDDSGHDLSKYLGGDWRGIIEKIEDGYLTDMGFNVIWISQPVENVFALRENVSSYHGYWARDFKRPNPLFGSMEDFRELIRIAHEHDMKIVIDFAPHHTSPAEVGDLGYMEDGVLLDNGRAIASYNWDPHNCFHHAGDSDEDFDTYEDGLYKKLYGLAGLNVQNDIVDRYLKEAISLWIDTGIDGIRIDGVRHLPIGWLTSFVQTFARDGRLFIFGEWYLGKHRRDPRNPQLANESGMGLLDFKFANKLKQIMLEKEDDWSGFVSMLNVTEKEYERTHELVTFIDNHDLPRFTRENSIVTDIALVVLLTSRGIPSIYYGTEQYMTGASDPANRQMMNSFNKQTPAYNIIRILSGLRKRNMAIAQGKTSILYHSPEIIVYQRAFGGHVVVVATNLGTTSVEFMSLYTQLPEGSYSNLVGEFRGEKEVNVDKFGKIEAMVLHPYDSVVLGTSDHFEYQPAISHIFPAVSKRGDKVCIYGTAFDKQQGRVKVGTVEAHILNWQDDSIEIVVPELTPGKHHVEITRIDTESAVYQHFRINTGEQVSVRFIVDEAYANDDEQIYLIGNVFELGNWEPAKAIGSFFKKVLYQYPTWYYDISVPAGIEIQYKYIKKNFSGEVVYEDGENHVWVSPTDQTGEVRVTWGCPIGGEADDRS